MLALGALGAKPAQAGTVTVKGSDTMVVLGQRWAEEYMAKHKGTTIQVTGGGSGTGISALINGTTDVCEASRAMKDAEKKQVADKAGGPPVEITVAKDGLSVYVNDSNAVKELTMAQLKDIFTGKVTDWKEVGRPGRKIIPYSRENSSGTYVFFKEHVLQNADYTPRAQAMPGTAAVVNAVARDKVGIGYGGGAYAKGINVLKVKKDAGIAGHRARRTRRSRTGRTRCLARCSSTCARRRRPRSRRSPTGCSRRRGRPSSPRSATSPSSSVKKRAPQSTRAGIVSPPARV